MQIKNLVCLCIGAVKQIKDLDSTAPILGVQTDLTSYSNHAMICALIVMKCKGFSQISDLHDYLSNNLINAHYCGFDITKELPS